MGQGGESHGPIAAFCTFAPRRVPVLRINPRPVRARGQTTLLRVDLSSIASKILRCKLALAIRLAAGRVLRKPNNPASAPAPTLRL